MTKRGERKKSLVGKSITRIIFDKLKIYDLYDDTLAIKFAMQQKFSKEFFGRLEAEEQISFLVNLLTISLEKFTDKTKSTIKELNELLEL